MRTIIAGSRSVTDISHIAKAVQLSQFHITEVVSGGARGVDKLGEQWARSQGIPVSVFPADWGLYGKAAGYRRNVGMSEYADALVAIWDGSSRGTAHMIEQAKIRKMFLMVHIVK